MSASTHENRASELMLDHLDRQGVPDRLELVTAAAARTLGRGHDLEVRRVWWDDEQPTSRPIRHAWRVGRLGRSRRLAKSFENTTSCDGTHALGLFWSRVLDWPLVWDEGEETAIQSPDGGSKFTWSGPPLMPRDSPERISLHIAAQGPEDLARLIELGATALGGERFLDPDGNEFIVTSR